MLPCILYVDRMLHTRGLSKVLGHSVPTATIGFGFSRIVSHKMTYVIFLSNITSLLSVAGFKMAAYLGANLVIISSILCIFSSFFR